MKRQIKVFTLPNEESLLNELLSVEGIVITEEIATPCPKEGIILYLVKYEDYNENNSIF